MVFRVFFLLRAEIRTFGGFLSKVLIEVLRRVGGHELILAIETHGRASFRHIPSHIYLRSGPRVYILHSEGMAPISPIWSGSGHFSRLVSPVTYSSFLFQPVHQPVSHANVKTDRRTMTGDRRPSNRPAILSSAAFVSREEPPAKLRHGPGGEKDEEEEGEEDG